jgi:hypothetical protein
MRALLLLLILASCARQHENSGTLPSSWTTGNGTEEPSAETNAAVDSVFRANLEALNELRETAPPLLAGHPADWAPWHLDGITASFSVTEGGVFGALLFAGTETVKATWQKKAAQRAPRENSAHFSARSSAVEINDKLEGVVRAFLLSGKVKDENALRANLHRQGANFVAFSRSLDGMRSMSGWRVAGLQLALAVNASGQVTPAIGVGGSLAVILDWDVSDSASPTAVAIPGTQKIRSMAASLAAEIPAALANAPEIRDTGLVLDQVQLGLGIDAGGNFGVVQADFSVVGRVILKRGRGAELTAFGPENRLRKGLVKALRMSTYFTKAARRAENGKYQLTQIETELDLGAGGDLKLATVTGIGQFLLDFDRPSSGEVL